MYLKFSVPPVKPLVTDLIRSRPAARLSFTCIAVLVALLALVIVPNRAVAQRPVGIDVSTWQGLIDWPSVKQSGISFAWARASEGTNYIDPYFTINEANAKAAGVLIGAYHHAHFDTNTGPSGAIAEANYFWNVAKDYIMADGSYLMPMVDVEGSTAGYDKNTLSEWVNQWCLTLSNNAAAVGVTLRPVIYASSSFANSYFDNRLTQWIPWIASWNGQIPQSGAPTPTTSPWPTWTVWQYDHVITVPGITANVVDQDVFNGSWSSLVTTLVIGGTTSLGPPLGARVGFNFMDPGDDALGYPGSYRIVDGLAPTDIAGAVPQAGWSCLWPGGGPYTTNVAAGIRFYWDAYGGGTSKLGYGGIPPGASSDSHLMRGYLDTGNNTTNNVIVSSVPFPLYDVLCYSKGNNGTSTRVARFTLSATNNGVQSVNLAKYVQDDGGSLFNGTYVEANSTNNYPNAASGNYCRFYAVRGTNFVVRDTGTYGSDVPRGPFNALQIVQVDPTPTLSNPSYANGQFQCFLNGATNASYVIQASTDLMNPASWLPVSTNTAPAQITLSTSGYDHRFYRALFQ